MMNHDGAPSGQGSEESSSPSVSYLKYNFLIVGNFSNLIPADIDYLESQGCFQVPRRDILDDIVQQYFLRMHTFLPILHEGDFWSAYYHRGSLNSSFPQTSLLVLHAMMFISCNYASQETIKSLGFSTSRAAKASFYRKAKLLYDFETETNPVYISQAALILSFRASMDTLSVKKATWLSIAIRHAETVGANNYATLYPKSAPLSKADAKTKNTLKRLWWGCIIRDRVLALCLRGGLQINRTQSEMALADPLTFDDQKDEMSNSNVYAPETKRYLARIFENFASLCSVLTDVLTLVYPLNERLRGQIGSDAEQREIQDAQHKLRQWHKNTTNSLQELSRLNPPTNCMNQNDSSNAVTLYIGMMHIFYYTARISLTQHQAFRLVGHYSEAAMAFEQTREMLQSAVSGSTKTFKRLRETGLDRWLTSSAVGCIATPLLLHILDVKLLNHFSASVDADIVAESHRRLNALFDNMNTYCSQFELVDFVVNVVRSVANSVHLEQLQHMLLNTVIYKWTDVLALNPEIYLRSVLILDLSLSRGRLPQEGEFSKFLVESAREQRSRESVLGHGTLQTNSPQLGDFGQTPLSSAMSALETMPGCTVEFDLDLFDDRMFNFEQIGDKHDGHIESEHGANIQLGNHEPADLEEYDFGNEESMPDIFMGAAEFEMDSISRDMIRSPL